MRDFSRAQRIGDQIQRELADVIQRGVRDPRLGMVTISGVRLSRDMGHAKVFITVLDDKHEIADTVVILNKAAGYLRHELAMRTLLRSVPQLRFIYDPSVQRGADMAALINTAINVDEQHAREHGNEEADELPGHE